MILGLQVAHSKPAGGPTPSKPNTETGYRMNTERLPGSVKRDNTRLLVCSCVSAAALTIAVVALPLCIPPPAAISTETGTAKTLAVRVERRELQSSGAPSQEARPVAELSPVEFRSSQAAKPVITAPKSMPTEIEIPVQDTELADHSRPTKDWRELLSKSAAETVAVSTEDSYRGFDRLRREGSTALRGKARTSKGTGAGLDLPEQLVYVECPPNASYNDSMRDRCLSICTPWPRKSRLFVKNELLD